ncbi:Nuclear egress protein 2 [Bienertia sinuspersici]
MAFNKEWMKIIDRTSREYREGVDSFLNFTFSNITEGDDTTTVRCPCDKCRNLVFKKKCDVRFDVLKYGMYENYTTWNLHGENTNEISSGSHINMQNSDVIESDDSGLNMEHKIMLEHESPRNMDRRHKMQFTKWVYDRLKENQVL